MTATYHSLTKESVYPVSSETLYNYHASNGCIERLVPPWQDVSVLERSGGLGSGGKTRLKLHAAGFAMDFEAEHLQAVKNEMFEDIQKKGPFKHWHHKHFFRQIENHARLTDQLEYQLPFDRILPSFIKKYVADDLKKTFSYRHYILAHDLQRHRQYSNRSLTILVSGASGVIGRELVPFLRTGGHEVWSLVRRTPDPAKNEIYWNPARGEIDTAALPQLDAVIHLAGEYIGLGRWNDEKKKEVIESRRKGTSLLAKTISKMENPPGVFLSSSAIGYYGDCGNKLVNEQDDHGQGFMAEVCRVWEQSTSPATTAGIRTVLMRIGVTLSRRGGALKKLMQIGRIGFPGSFGSGKQFTSWISSDDLVSAILHCICTKNISGPINLAAPNPVTNEELLYTLAKLKGKPILPRVPKSYLTFFYGEMASEIALSGCRVSARKLIDSGFHFSQPTITEAIKPQFGIFD